MSLESVEAGASRPTFDALPLSPEVKRALQEMGFIEPTPVQLGTYQHIVDRKDLVVQSRTGTGKTAAFGIPLIDRLVRPTGGVQALILAPTRELALQSARELERIGRYRDLTTTAVYGGAPFDRQVRQLKKGSQIVSGTPGRVLDHLRRGTLQPATIRILILDEADEMLSMGFAKELNAIIELLPTERQTLLFSATVDGAVSRITRTMKAPEFVMLSGDSIGAEGISHAMYFVTGKNREHDLVRILETEDPESAVVFCNTKATTEAVAAALQQAGFDADWLNGDLPQGEREKVMARTRQGSLRFLVATDVAARGIDISHLTHVINYELPDGVEQYIHRTGRTGRAGRTGTALSLVSPQELGAVYYLRLQYRITPIERSLPTAGEQRTRIEADRVALLEAAFPNAPDALHLAVARRLLTHPSAERLLAGLLEAFFGSKGEEIDEQAAAARRSRPPPAIDEPKPMKDGRQEEEPRPHEARDRERSRSPRRAEHSPSREEGARSRAASEPGKPMGTLCVNVGRRDGMRAGEISKLIRERTGIGRGDLGRIRVRDNHALVQVSEEHIARVIESMQGASVGERAVAVERAGSRSSENQE